MDDMRVLDKVIEMTVRVWISSIRPVFIARWHGMAWHGLLETVAGLAV
jgi:hypothetical protein